MGMHDGVGGAEKEGEDDQQRKQAQPRKAQVLSLTESIGLPHGSVHRSMVSQAVLADLRKRSQPTQAATTKTLKKPSAQRSKPNPDKPSTPNKKKNPNQKNNKNQQKKNQQKKKNNQKKSNQQKKNNNQQG